MLKSCSIVYFPGIGGNFIKLCLSLSPETAPYYYKHLDSYSDEKIIGIRKISSSQRREIIKYSTVEDYKKIHSNTLAEPDFYYRNPLINQYFDWSIVSNHPDNYESRLPWLKKIIYVELDLEKYGKWIDNARLYFGQFGPFGGPYHNHQLTKIQSDQEQQVKNYDITTTVSMTEVLTGVDGFVNEYLRACDALTITPEVDQVIPFYQDWRALRVDPFI